jgi:hypothetical protein
MLHKHLYQTIINNCTNSGTTPEGDEESHDGESQQAKAPKKRASNGEYDLKLCCCRVPANVFYFHQQGDHPAGHPTVIIAPQQFLMVLLGWPLTTFLPSRSYEL